MTPCVERNKFNSVSEHKRHVKTYHDVDPMIAESRQRVVGVACVWQPRRALHVAATPRMWPSREEAWGSNAHDAREQLDGGVDTYWARRSEQLLVRHVLDMHAMPLHSTDDEVVRA